MFLIKHAMIWQILELFTPKGLKICSSLVNRATNVENFLSSQVLDQGLIRYKAKKLWRNFTASFTVKIKIKKEECKNTPKLFFLPLLNALHF